MSKMSEMDMEREEMEEGRILSADFGLSVPPTPAEVAPAPPRTVETVTLEIRTLQRQAQQIMLSYAVEIGRRLEEVKAILPHGQWGDYLKNEVDYSQSTANNFMRIYREYGAAQQSLFGGEAKELLIMKKILALILSVVLVLSLVGCSEADKVNANLSKDADYFNCERRITVYNARTDTIILTVEGYMSISNNSSSELVVTCKTGANEYKKNYVYLNDYTLYVVEDVTGTHTDPYHYKMYFHTEFPFDVEARP